MGRKLLAWAASSGVKRQSAWPASNDKPGMNFGIPSMDDFSAQKALMAVVPALKRDVICMELDANLQSAERVRALKRFPASDFKRVAVVAMGQPTDAYKARIHKMMLDKKIKEAEKEKKKLQEEEKPVELTEEEKAVCFR